MHIEYQDDEIQTRICCCWCWDSDQSSDSEIHRNSLKFHVHLSTAILKFFSAKREYSNVQTTSLRDLLAPSKHQFPLLLNKTAAKVTSEWPHTAVPGESPRLRRLGRDCPPAHALPFFPRFLEDCRQNRKRVSRFKSSRPNSQSEAF